MWTLPLAYKNENGCQQWLRTLLFCLADQKGNKNLSPFFFAAIYLLLLSSERVNSGTRLYYLCTDAALNRLWVGWKAQYIQSCVYLTKGVLMINMIFCTLMYATASRKVLTYSWVTCSKAWNCWFSQRWITGGVLVAKCERLLYSVHEAATGGGEELKKWSKMKTK